MAKKYLSVDEAASRLGLTVDQVRRAIDRGDLRAYRDGGSHKLSEQHVDEYGRTLQADSSPEIPLLPDDEIEIDLSASDSDVRLMADEPAPDRGSLKDLVNSGSDVRLSGDSGPRLGGKSDRISVSDSDSDVRLSEGSDSDSDVRLSDALDATGEIPAGALDSDSDVKLFGADDLLADDSDSDVKLSPPGSDIRLGSAPGSAAKSILPPDSDLKLIDRPSSIRAGAAGSGINLAGADSGISLALDSGISLEANDSGISLESYGSRTNASGDDSGISLDGGDSGISLDLDDDVVPGPADVSRTQPMQAIPGARRSLADSGKTTQLEIPSPVIGKDSEFELAGLDDDDAPGTSTSVLTFEDDDLGDSKTIAAPALGDSSAEFSDESPAEEEYTEGYEDDGGYGAEEEFEDYDGADEDGDGDEGGFAGTAAVAGATAVVRRAEVDWGIGIKLMIGCSAVLGVVCSVVGIELMRTMWIWTQPGNNAEASPVLSLIGGLF
jgi:excisionase family DNA binding protein